MKKTLLSLAIASLAAGQSVCAAVEKVYNEPDSVYIFSYAHPEDEGRSGLKFAWSPDGDKWLSVSDGFAYLKCDFGRWGAEKRMIKPLLEKAEDGRWYCRWQLTPSGKVWGTSHSSDLLKWAPQQYVNAEKPAVPRLVTARQIVLDKDTLNGYMQKVPYADIEQLIRFAEHKKFRDIQNNERTEQDAVRFAGLKPVTATIRVDAGRVKIPAGWMIDQCGWKGKALGPAAVHDKQALVLVNLGGATEKDVVALSDAVRASVKEKFGVEICPEVNFIE